MALVKKRSNSTRAAIILVVGLVVAVVGYFLFQRFANPSTNVNTGIEGTGGNVISNFGESILDASVFEPIGFT